MIFGTWSFSTCKLHSSFFTIFSILCSYNWILKRSKTVYFHKNPPLQLTSRDTSATTTLNYDLGFVSNYLRVSSIVRAFLWLFIKQSRMWVRSQEILNCKISQNACNVRNVTWYNIYHVKQLIEILSSHLPSQSFPRNESFLQSWVYELAIKKYINKNSISICLAGRNEGAET